MNIRNLFDSMLGRKAVDVDLEPSERDANSLIEALRQAMPDNLKWEWDERSDCIVAAFHVDQEASMHDAVNAQFQQQWTRSELRRAPQTVQKAAKDFGGLTPGQLLFASGLDEGIMFLGLWWPWGNRATISLRFTAYGTSEDKDQVEAIRAQLREKFEL